MGKRLSVLFLEPFYGGSHRAFADGLKDHSRHDIELVTLPARFWKWRMRGAAIYFSRAVATPEAFDVLLCSDMMSLVELKGLWKHCPPSIVYFHENQLSYPVPEGEKIDYHFAFTNATTAIAADRVVFNSHFHRSGYFAELERFLRKLPEFSPHWAVEEIRAKSLVIYPGCRLPGDTADTPARRRDRRERPLIVWNHRWEFDKQPAVFFDALYAVAARGIDFEVALLGENFQAVPKPFLEAKERLGGRIIAYGYLDDPAEYRSIIERGRVVVSTAIQENFGISVVEATHSGCLPLLPDRLSYPEVIPDRFHDLVLYRSFDDLVERLATVLSGPPPDTADLRDAMRRYSWAEIAPQLDSLIDEVAG